MGVRYFAMLLWVAACLALGHLFVTHSVGAGNGRVQVVNLVLVITAFGVLGVGWFLVLRPAARRIREDYEAIRELHARTRLIVDSALDAVVAIDADGRIRDWNPQAERIFGWRREEILGRFVEETLIPERYREAHRSGIRRFLETGDRSVLGRRVEMAALHRDGREFPVELAVAAVPSGSSYQFCAFVRDITVWRETLESLRREKETAQTYLDIAGVIMLVVGRDQRVVRINQKGCEILGYPESEIVGRNWFDAFLPQRMREAVRALFDQIVAGATRPAAYFEMPIVTRGGEERLVAWHNTVIRDATGAFVATLSSGEDITYRKESERKLLELNAKLEEANRRLERLVLEDPLTELMNRRGLQRVLSRELRWVSREGGNLLAVLIDLDNFKQVNDGLGHAVGDVVLKEVAARLKACLRGTDYAARIGGDEFLVLLPKTPPADGIQIAERIRMVVGGRPVPHPGGEVRVTASLGVVEVTDRTPTIDDLLRLTHRTLHESKEGGKNRASYTWASGHRPRSGGAARVVEDLQRGDRFRVVSQPIMAVAEETPVGYELFSRSTIGPYEMPEDFFRLCAEVRVLANVDRHCLRSCVTAATSLPPDARRHVNLFPATLAGMPLGDLLAVFPSERPPGGFCLEISSRRIQDNTFRLGEIFRALRQDRILTAIDDVGLEGDSLASLVVLAPDLVKIDRAGVEGVGRDAARARALRSLLVAVRDLGAEVIVEGVQTREDLEALRALGVKYAQGFLWGQPVACAAGACRAT